MNFDPRALSLPDRRREPRLVANPHAAVADEHVSRDERALSRQPVYDLGPSGCRECLEAARQAIAGSERVAHGARPTGDGGAATARLPDARATAGDDLRMAPRVPDRDEDVDLAARSLDVAVERSQKRSVSSGGTIGSTSTTPSLVA